MVEHPPRAHVIDHRSRHGRWQAVSAAPDPRLLPYVRGYLGYRERMTRFARRRELPTGEVGLIISFETPVRVIDRRRPASSTLYPGAFVAGPDDRYGISDTGGSWYGMQVAFTPLGAYRFFALPMAELARREVALEDLDAGLGRRLPEALHDAPSWDARFDLLDAVIAARVLRAPSPSPAVAWAWQRLDATRGGVRIGDLAAELGTSRKHLSVRFRQQVGLPPKALARVLRFHGAVHRLERGGVPRFADLALDCGYYDQAHFNRDFRRFAGSPPRAFLRRHLPDRGGVIAD